MTSIRVENLGKSYRVGHANEQVGYLTLRESIANFVATPIRRLRNPGTIGRAEEFWALRDVSFEVPEGEVVGFIGRNGAGKSTLLKIISRITSPTTGRIELRGRVGSLLEVGTGFHPELTGRENILLNGAILGMSRREILQVFDEIVDFSGVSHFLDTPVKRYSSGMQVRLAFSVAAHLEPDILLVDEVLAVGDAEFQKKCLGRMHDVASSGRTVLFVSHNMTVVENLCDRVFHISNGRIESVGEPKQTIQRYLEGQREAPSSDGHFGSQRDANFEEVIRDFRILDENGNTTDSIQSGSPVTFEIDYEYSSELTHPVFGIRVDSLVGQVLFSLDTRMQHGFIEELPRIGTVQCSLDRLPLISGAYALNLGCKIKGHQADLIERAAVLNVQEADYFGTGWVVGPNLGHSLVPAEWSFGSDESPAE